MSLIHWRAGLPFRELCNMEKRADRTSGSSANAYVKSCPWGGIITSNNKDWEPTGSTFARRNPTVDRKLNMSQQCALVEIRDYRMLGCIMKNVTNKWRKLIIPLCSEDLRPHLKYCVKFWALQWK